MRKPRDLDKYSTAEGAARGLEALASDIRKAARIHPLVSWNIHVRYWNPAWETKPKGKTPAPTSSITETVDE